MNIYKRLIDLLPSNRMDVGTVAQVFGDAVLVELQSGGYVRVTGTSTVGTKVFIKSGQVIGEAPNLTGSIIEV